jgi:hypothetical protein
LAERIRGEDATQDVDAFLKESRDSLHGKYWGPDSLVPVRLVDMRDEPPPEPVRTRRRIRPLDIVVGTVGLGAALLLVVFLRDEKHETAKAAPAAQVRPRVPSVAAVHAPVAREIVTPSMAPPPTIVEAPAPAVSPSATETAESVPSAVPIVALMSTPESAPAEQSPATTEQPALAAASSAATDPAASAAPTQVPKKRRPKPATHAPPTASFPD